MFLFIIPAIAFAAGEGTYGNETYGNSSYGISSSSSASFSNDSVATIANASTIVNATQGASSPNVVLEFVTNSNTTGAVTLVKYDSQPPSVGTNTFASPLNKYLDIVVGNSISSQLNYSIIKMYYTGAEVAAANIQESTMRLSKWNGSEWIKFDAPIGGVDTANKFVWANTSSFSVWGLFGTSNPNSATSTAPSAKPKVLDEGGGSLPPEENAPAAPKSAPTPAPAPAENKPAPKTTSPTAQSTTTAPPPTGFAALTGAFISGLAKPGTITAIIGLIIVVSGLYAGYYYLYKRKQ